MYLIFKIVIVLFVLNLNIDGLSSKALAVPPSDNLTTETDNEESQQKGNNSDSQKYRTANRSDAHESEQRQQHNDEYIASSTVAATVNIDKSLLKAKAYMISENAAQAQDDNELDTTEEKDLKSLLVKYDADDGNSCLLDLIKDEVLWWTFQNGTLKVINTKYSSNIFLDLSHRHVSDDLELLNQTKSSGRYSSKHIEIFSAAYNALTSAPFKTLSSMKSTLKILSLRGNQFAALLTDATSLGRLVNETRSDTSTVTQTKCDNFSSQKNDTDLYNRECLLQNQNTNTNNTNTNTNNNSNSSTAQLSEMQYKDYLQYYQQRNNYFGQTTEGIAWATFPILPHLLELDISNCSIEYITKDAFQNITNLRRLFMSNNKMMSIPYDAFEHIQQLEYLDLSFTNVFNYNYQLSMPTLEVVLNLVYGLKIQQTTFKLLPKLIYLDLSHSKMTRNSAVAFTHLGNKLKYLSLCFTAFPMVSNALFKNTVLEGLDLSGNPFISYNIIDDAFDGIAGTLKYLYFEHSNLKDLDWAKSLKNLQILGLAGNNINGLSTDTFQALPSLQVLDLSSNHVGNWYKSAFRNNTALRVLNLRDNNINIITTEMLKDFESLQYLSIGDNNFLCDCMLRELVEVGAGNNNKAECSYDILQQASDLLLKEAQYWHASQGSSNQSVSVETMNMQRTIWQRYVPQLRKSYMNIRNYKRLNKVFKIRLFSKAYTQAKCPTAQTSYQLSQQFTDTTLKFQLLDYDEEHYWCFNQTEQMQVGALNCQARIMLDLETKLHSLTTIIVAVVASILGISIIAVIIYLKRWHIHYYFSSLKSAALLSSASKESVDRFNRLVEHDPSLIYDIFISYCQNDRQWVLDELLPNVEETGDVSICLHERDFQIGVTILDNIVSCMDRSRSLMLIISSKFLLSHWCQFEMYLAQHRIFEVSKEHLILVFLEDIPRNKRPKTLQYLMDVKTYIKWPADKDVKKHKLDERKLFWKRLRRSLQSLGISSRESNT